MTSGDLTFDLTKKRDRSDFFLIFDALSNAAFPVSLRGPGAELEGGVQTPPQQGVEIQDPQRDDSNSYIMIHIHSTQPAKAMLLYHFVDRL